jgi:hypothetical protein
MENLTTISCSIGTTDVDAALGIEVWIDDQCALNLESVTDTVPFEHQISDDENKHVIKFVMKNKQPTHTKIDEQGNIISDACLTIGDVKFENIALGQIFIDLAQYQHDFNGTGTSTVEKFYGQMGCNGTVSLEFDTPMYLWLLENI